MKKRLADVLMRLVRRLDPDRPTVKMTEHGWTIFLRATPLAEIKPGMINDTRPVWNDE